MVEYALNLYLQILGIQHFVLLPRVVVTVAGRRLRSLALVLLLGPVLRANLFIRLEPTSAQPSADIRRPLALANVLVHVGVLLIAVFLDELGFLGLDCDLGVAVFGNSLSWRALLEGLFENVGILAHYHLLAGDELVFYVDLVVAVPIVGLKPGLRVYTLHYHR